MPTLWITRFMDALEVLARHTMNIAIIEAAMLLAEQPIKGEGHEVRGKSKRASHERLAP